MTTITPDNSITLYIAPELNDTQRHDMPPLSLSAVRNGGTKRNPLHCPAHPIAIVTGSVTTWDRDLGDMYKIRFACGCVGVGRVK